MTQPTRLATKAHRTLSQVQRFAASVTLAIIALTTGASDASAGPLPIVAYRARVATCAPFVVFRSDEYNLSYRASQVVRSPAISCVEARSLLMASYHSGPLRPIRIVYRHDARGREYGRGTVWLKGGWRCTNGAGGAACWNVRTPGLNVIHNFSAIPVAVAANVQ